MTRKEIKKFFLSLISDPDANWWKEDYGRKFTVLHCKINNIKVICDNHELKFIYVDEQGYITKSEEITLEELGISLFAFYFPYFGYGWRIIRRIKRDTGSNSEKLKNISDILTKDKALDRDRKIDQILK